MKLNDLFEVTYYNQTYDVSGPKVTTNKKVENGLVRESRILSTLNEIRGTDSTYEYTTYPRNFIEKGNRSGSYEFKTEYWVYKIHFIKTLFGGYHMGFDRKPKYDEPPYINKKMELESTFKIWSTIQKIVEEFAAKANPPYIAWAATSTQLNNLYAKTKINNYTTLTKKGRKDGFFVKDKLPNKIIMGLYSKLQ